MRAAFLLICLSLLPLDSGAAQRKNGISWEPWSDSIFERAKKENKFVLLDLEAVWCHWCHVMDEKTYGNPKVAELIASKYIPVRVDQDSRPDLANKYEDYGWPATIVFGPDGGEIVKRQGYLPPEEMISMLEAIIKDPTPGPSVKPAPKITYTDKTLLAPDIRAELERRLNSAYDAKLGGWGNVQKFMDWDAVEYSIALAIDGDYQAERRAKQTLAAQLKLLDPVWGGVYQYSTDGDWDHPHFEKIMQFQGENLRLYGMGFGIWGNDDYLKAAEDIRRYLKNFLMSPDGAFYTSQDADVVVGKHSADYFALSDAERRKKGVPKVDTHIYARENGWAIRGLVSIYSAVGGDPHLDEAVRAAEWTFANRSLPGGGFRHDEKDSAGPYLGDTLSMGAAFLDLYTVTTDRKWLTRAESAAQFILKNFKRNPAGFATAVQGKSPIQPALQIDENVGVARFGNLLYQYTGRKEFRAMAEHAMRYLATPQIALSRKVHVAGILLADRELASEPLHVTVVGRRDDSRAGALFSSALNFTAPYRRIEWWDPELGPLPRMNVEFPRLKLAAAYLCTANKCSAPIYRSDDLSKKLRKP